MKEEKLSIYGPVSFYLKPGLCFVKLGYLNGFFKTLLHLETKALTYLKIFQVNFSLGISPKLCLRNQA